MNKLFRFFTAFIFIMPIAMAHGAVAIKKATPVVVNTSDTKDNSASLLPSVISLATGIMDMNTKQKELTENCIPSTAERVFVDNMMKEWSKSGAVSSKQIPALLRGRQKCAPGDSYALSAQYSSAPGIALCYDVFITPSDLNNVWNEFPRVGFASYCADVSLNCSKKITMSDAYDLFAIIDFGPSDYTKQEATMAGKLLDKLETCTTSRLNAKKKALWGEFLVNTAGNVGQKTNTGTIMEQVGAISGAGGMGAITSFGGAAAQFMNK